MCVSISGLSFLFNYSILSLKIFFLSSKQFLKVITKYWLYSLCCTVHLWACLTSNGLYLPLTDPYILSVLEPILHNLNYVALQYIYIWWPKSPSFLFKIISATLGLCIPIYTLDYLVNFYTNTKTTVEILTGTVLNPRHFARENKIRLNLYN